MKAVLAENVHYAHHDGRVALDGISFALEDGAILGLVGPNGAGKTTLLLAVCGLIDFGGAVTVFGESLSMKNAHKVRSRMSLVFQNPDDQLFMTTVREDVAFGLKELGCSADEMGMRVGEAMEAVGLKGFEGRSAHHLSYGEKRKITLAAALARRSDLLIFDEPTRELDPGGRREFMGMMQGVRATKIIASHDLDMVAELATDILLIDHGRTIAFGKPPAVLSDTDLMEGHRLEVPAVYR